MNVSLKVKIFDEKGTRVLQVSKSSLTIGSASHCDVVFDDPSVNPEHTRAWLEGGRIWVQDLGSPTGTALNDIRLPALKPMLVRDLDVLRLGESKSTLGLEALVVRAPMVKPKTGDIANRDTASIDMKTLTGIDLEKRRDESQKLSRELADLRLQLQMARLDKSAAEEMNKELESLRAGVKHINEQKENWDKTLRQVEEEKQKMRHDLERELEEFKTKSLNDLQAEVMRLRESNQRLQSDREQHTTNLQQQQQQQSAQMKQQQQQQIAQLQQRQQQELAQIQQQQHQQIQQLQAQLRSSDIEKEVLRKNLEREITELKSKLTKDVQKINTDETSQQRVLQDEVKKLQATIKRLEAEAVDAKNRLQTAIADGKRTSSDESRRQQDQNEALRKEMERQISEVRAKASKEQGAHAIAEAQKFERWKQEQANIFNKTLHNLLKQKARTWTVRGVPPEMVNEWEGDVNHLFRRIVLNDTSPMPVSASLPPVDKAEKTQVHPIAEREQGDSQKKKTRRGFGRWKTFAFPSLFVVLVALGLWYGPSLLKSHGVRTFSSLAPTTDVKKAAPFVPKQSKKYRGSYTENVIYLENYVGAEGNVEFRRRWQAELNKVASTEWKIDSFTIAPVIVEEQKMIQDLNKIRQSINTTDKEAEGLEKMHAREGKFLHDLEGIFKSQAGVDRFLKFKRAFYVRNQAYLSTTN